MYTQLAEGLKSDSSADVNMAIRARMDEVFSIKLKALHEEERHEVNPGLEVQLAARSFGAISADEHNGVILAVFQNKDAVAHYFDYLERNPSVETYELEASGVDIDSGESGSVDIDNITSDTGHKYHAFVYMHPDETVFDDDYEDGDIEDQLEDSQMESEDLTEAYHAAGTINGKPWSVRYGDFPSKGQIAKHNEHLSSEEHSAIHAHIEDHSDDDFTGTKSNQKGHKVVCTHNGGYHGESEEIEGEEIDEAKAADELPPIDQSAAAKRKAMQAKKDALEDRDADDWFGGKTPKATAPKKVARVVKGASYAGGASKPDEDDEDSPPKAIAAAAKRGRGRPRKHPLPEGIEITEDTDLDSLDEESDEQIMEVLRKIRINSRGQKSIKMKCAKGFKWDESIRACLKITGSEVAVMRRASRKALLTKRAEGGALKVRFKRRINKAFRFRKLMGMKI